MLTTASICCACSCLDLAFCALRDKFVKVEHYSWWIRPACSSLQNSSFQGFWLCAVFFVVVFVFLFCLWGFFVYVFGYLLFK